MTHKRNMRIRSNSTNRQNVRRTEEMPPRDMGSITTLAEIMALSAIVVGAMVGGNNLGRRKVNNINKQQLCQVLEHLYFSKYTVIQSSLANSTLTDDPPENCHLTVKKYTKT